MQSFTFGLISCLQNFFYCSCIFNRPLRYRKLWLPRRYRSAPGSYTSNQDEL